MTKKILVSNDDGISAEGLPVLKKALEQLGEVTVVAPDRERSAVSHSLTLKRPLRIMPKGERMYAVDGTPADCVHLAINGIMRDSKPDLVVSGINAGCNWGQDVYYSGTVSAAREAALLGCNAFAISLDGRNGYYWEAAAIFAVRVAKYVLKNGLPKGVILNVNVPNLPPDQVTSYRITRQGKCIYGDAVVEKIDPRGEKYYWIGGQELGFEHIEGSDIQTVLNGEVSITPMNLEMTNYVQLAELSGIKL